MNLPELLNREFLCFTLDSGSDAEHCCLEHCGIGGTIVETGGG